MVLYVFDLEEPLEDPLAVRFRDSGPLVADAEDRLAVRLLEPDSHGTALGGVLPRVVQQYSQHPDYLVGVDVYVFPDVPGDHL